MINQRTVLDYLVLTAKWMFLSFFLFVTFMPLFWLVISSFKTNFEFQTQPFGFPAVWQFQNYVRAVEVSQFHLLFFNSVFVALGATALNIIVASMAAFVLSREQFRHRNTILNIMVAGVLVPIISLMVPYFRIIRTLDLHDSLFALVLVYGSVNIPISVFLIHGFMTGIPKELEESASMDGCTFVQRYTKIIFPLSRMGLVTAGTFVFLYSWNEFIYALLLTSSISARTLQLGIRFFRSQFLTDFTSMYAAIVLTIIPSIMVYMFFHEKIIQGLTSGAVKG